MADGCLKNSCPLNQISENLGLLSPSIRCVAHDADGTIEQMVNSRSACSWNLWVSAITSNNYTSSSNKWQKSGFIEWSIACSRNEATSLNEILSYSNELFTYSSSTVSEVTCANMWRASISRDETCFIFPKSMIVMLLSADPEAVFWKSYLRLLDWDNGLIIKCVR